MSSEGLVHVLLVSFPGQGHVNPLLRLGNLLAAKGLLVTFSTPQNVGKVLRKANKMIDKLTPIGEYGGMIRFEFFEDGLDEDDLRRNDLNFYMPQLQEFGSKAVVSIIKKHEQQGRPISCIINNLFIPWVSDLAETLNIPSAVLWVQSCACFSAYYHFHHKLLPFPTDTDLKINVQLPCMPLLKYDEIPSFLHPSDPFLVLGKLILGQFKNLSKPFCVLMETFQELEDELLTYMSNYCNIKPIGPLFINPITDPTSTVRADFIKADDCVDWLDSKEANSSVVYISFGSVIYLKQEQLDEIANGLLNSGVCFLWVLRPAHDSSVEPAVLPDGFLEKAGDKGKVVQWCSQEKVLSHRAVACFVTHCGWNSSLEALSCGVPVVAFPAWGDQVTNAKYLVDVLNVGVRLSRGDAEKRIIGREEVEKRIREVTSGPKAVEMKENALKWKKAAKEAVAEGGSSDRNLQDFVDEIKRKRIMHITQ